MREMSLPRFGASVTITRDFAERYPNAARVLGDAIDKKQNRFDELPEAIDEVVLDLIPDSREKLVVRKHEGTGIPLLQTETRKRRVPGLRTVGKEHPTKDSVFQHEILRFVQSLEHLPGLRGPLAWNFIREVLFYANQKAEWLQK